MGGALISIVIVINFILQTTLLRYASIGGVLPNTALLIVISLSLIKGSNKGAAIGFFCGLLQDIFYGKVIGINMIAYMTIGFVIGFIDEKLFRDSLFVPVLFAATGTVAYYIIFLFFLFFLKIDISFIKAFGNVILPEAIYNSALALLFFKGFYRLEKRYNDKFNLRFTKN